MAEVDVPGHAESWMVSEISSKLKIWWENFDLGSQMEIRRRLGCLVSLFDISPDQHLELRYFENNWISLDYLYERCDCRDGYKLFKNEFSCTPDHWQARRPIAFVVALLGTLIFPLEHGKISTCICSVARSLFGGVDGAQLTLAPMILAEIFRALGKCKRGETSFFEGCNLILQMWEMEHFYQRPNMVDICFSESNKIVSFYDKTKRFVSPVGTNDWYKFLASHTSDQIQWKYPLLLSAKKAYIRCRRLYYIELIGLKGLQTYAPLSVLRQFVQEQIVPFRANIRVSEIQFGPNFIISRARQILDEWNDIDKMDIGDSRAGGTPEYHARLREDHGNTNLSPKGEQGFEDIGTTVWVRNFWLKDTVVTLEMWHQMQNIMQYLEDAGAGPSSVRASSSSPIEYNDASDVQQTIWPRAAAAPGILLDMLDYTTLIVVQRCISRMRKNVYIIKLPVVAGRGGKISR
ncbi:hypothetical protein RND71_025886 [Anisodus tanguticus]|uniref:Aminotransferase-like plant mobile domain-containing protein n=1 Tax=Anisodus tanguticus TaxID=243964 RepID=A0AAE1V3A5_9SOLA|nr:hypothetical protein RND71_025886 [Anisodus tanguticus]